MKIRQLQYVCEIAKHGCNITAAALALHTAQPGISKQLKALEDELGTRIFHRRGNRLSGLTSNGKLILASVNRIVQEVGYLRAITHSREQDSSGALTIATTHTQARYVLPALVKRFTDLYPKVGLTLRHAKPSQIVELVSSGEVDFGVTTNAPMEAGELVVLPCLKFSRAVIVPSGHALLRKRQITLKNLAGYPLITYDAGFSGGDEILKAFERARVNPQIVLRASDADVIKSCVEQGLGIAVLLGVVHEPERDKALDAIPVDHLFPRATISVVVQRRHHFRRFDYDFIEMLSTRWHRSNVQRAVG